jgi:two-component system, sensor histidine kinase RpfC
VSWGMHVGDEFTSLLYPMYLWAIFGNGFRFGVNYLFLATAISVVGFSVVVVRTEYWASHLYLAVGLLAGLIILPLYAATLIRKLSAARLQAEEASKAKSRFLASVSHELRTPLNAIIGLSDLLRDTPLDGEQHEMTRTIGTAGRSLLALINSLLDFSRIEERRVGSNPVEFDLYGLLTDVRAILAVQAQAKSVRLALHITPRTPRFMKGEKRHLEEILINLGGNAVKFTEHGSVTIAVDATTEGDKIRLRCEVSDTGIGIAPEAQARIFESFTQADDTIMDRFGGTGLGLAISKQLVEFHGGAIGVESAAGSGSTFWFEMNTGAAGVAALPAARWPGPVVLLSSDLGLHDIAQSAGADIRGVATADEADQMLASLRQQGVRRPMAIIDAGAHAACGAAVAERMIAAHGPDTVLILVTDEPVVGMLPRALCRLFVTTLVRPVEAGPLAASLRLAAGSETSAAAAADAARPAERARRTFAVLVAEDNRTNQMVIAKILERAGHTVKLVDNGEGALDALEEGTFDIVLMDVNMPVMNGIEATKLYRFASLGNPHVPIVALTADATAEARTRCEEAGMDACVTKPIEPARLLELIDGMVPLRAGDTPSPMPEKAAGIEAAKVVPHPRLAATSVIDRQKLEDLEAIGGKDFVADLVVQFSADAAELVRELDAAAAADDAEAFRERAHALRSGAANIGARGVFELCLAWRQISANELASKGRQHVRKLTEEIDRAAAALAEHAATLRGEPAPAIKASGAVETLAAPARSRPA